MTTDILQNETDPEWRRWRLEWSIPIDVTYLNHGSFGPSPWPVQRARKAWSDRLEAQPMDFFIRQMEDELNAASEKLGAFIGAAASDLVFVDNATVAMNIVAGGLKLSPGDEVLLTDHEYGAVQRIWKNACREQSAKAVTCKLPFPITDQQEIVEAVFSSVTEKTRLIVVSHVTSPTAVILPVQKICDRAKERGVQVCIDGPHALAMLPVDIKELGCDFYAASCHKWLSGPFGSGFLYVDRKLQSAMKPVVTSWGGSLGSRPFRWQDEFNWIGTRDPAPFLAVPAAIEFLEEFGFEKFRQQTHQLTQYARQKISSLTGLEPFVPDSPDFYGPMISLPLPPLPAEVQKNLKPNQCDPLLEELWDQHKIELALSHWSGQRLLRVSCHLYNRTADIDKLVEALSETL